MVTDIISLTSWSIFLLVSLIAVVSCLLVFVGPWMYGKLSAPVPVSRGVQMDPRGPGGHVGRKYRLMRQLTPPNRSKPNDQNQTKHRSKTSRDSYHSYSYGGGYPSNRRTTTSRRDYDNDGLGQNQQHVLMNWGRSQRDERKNFFRRDPQQEYNKYSEDSDSEEDEYDFDDYRAD